MGFDIKVLVVESEDFHCEKSFPEMFAGMNAECITTRDADHFRELLFGTLPDLVLCTDDNENFSVQAVLEIVADFDPDLPVIILTPTSGHASVVEYLRASAADVIATDKPENFQNAIQKAVQTANARRERLNFINQLLDNEARMRSYIQNAPDGIIIANAKGKFTEANPAACILLGYTESELINMSFFELVAPDSLPDAEFFAEELIELSNAAVALKFIRSDNASRWLSIKSVAVGDGRYMGFIADITEKKEIERSHLESEYKFRQLFEESVYGIALHEIICDENGKPTDYVFLDFNPAYERMTGLNKEACIGKTVLELLPNVEPYWIDRFGAVALTGVSDQLEDYAQEFDKYYEVKAYSPKKGQFVVMISDNSEKHKMIETLRKSEEMYRMFFDHTDDVMFVMDLNFCYQYVSQSVIRFSGFSAEESLHHDIWSIVTPETGKRLQMIFAEQLNKITENKDVLNEIVSVEYEFVHRNGEHQFAEATLRFATDSSNNITGIIGIARNVTTRKFREHQILQRNNILRQLNKIGLELAKMTNEESIEFLVQQIETLFQPYAIVFSSYNADKKSLVPQIFSKRIFKNKLLTSIINKYVARNAFKVSESFVSEMMNLESVKFSDDLAEITFNSIEREVISRMEQRLGKKFFAAIPVTDGLQLYGALVIVFDQKEDVFFEDELQAFAAILRSALSRNSSENAVRNSELKYRTIIENTSDLIVVTNGFEPLYFNNKAQEFLKKFALTGDLFQLIKIIDKQDQQIAYDGYQKLTFDNFFEHTIRVYHQDQTYWFKLIARLIEWEGLPAVLTIASDISLIKRSEMLLIARNHVLSKMDEFLRLMHNSPLNEIYANAANYLNALFRAKYTMFNAFDKAEMTFTNRWSSFSEQLRDDVINCLGLQPNPISIPVAVEAYDELLNFKSYSLTNDIRSVFLYTISDDTANGLINILKVKQFACMPIFDNETILGAKVMMFEKEDEFELADELFAFVSLAGSVIQRRIAEDQAYETSISLKKAQLVAKMGSWEYDVETKHMQWSEQMYRMLNVPDDNNEDLNARYLSQVHPDDLPILMNLVSDIMINPEEKEIEVRLQPNDGDEIWVLNKLAPVLENERLIGISGVNIDITDRIKSQIELSDKQSYLQSIFNLAPVGIFTTDLNGVILDVNETFASIIGREPNSLLGFNTLSIPNQAVKEVIEKATKGEVGFYEGPYVSVASGKKSNIRFTMAPIKKADESLMMCIGVVDEISDIVEANAKLRESEERFTKSFYMSPIPMIIANLEEEEVLNVNPAFEQLMGYTYEDLYNSKKDSYINFLLPDDFHHLMEMIRRGIPIQNLEVDVVNASGAALQVMLSMETYKMEDKTLTLTSIVDLTELKHQQMELQKLMHAIEQLPVSIVITNTEGIIEYVNPKVVQTTGYSPKELIGQNPKVLKSGEMRSEDYQLIYQTLTQGNIWHGTFHNKHKNGSLFWEKATIAPVLNKEGAPIYYIAIKEDITHQKAMEEALASSEYRYREIFMKNPIPMWIYDVDTLCFKEVNTAAIEQYGYTEEEFMQMTLKDIRPEEDIPLLLESLKSIEQHSLPPRNFRHLIKSGQIIDVELASYLVPGSQSENLRMVVASNITDKLRARKALEEAKTMAEASDKLKTNFLNNISHEVRTPLNGILGATTLIADPTTEKDELSELVEIISMSTDRLIQTITDYMDISMLSSGAMPVNIKGCRVLDIVEKLRFKFEPAATIKGLQFHLRYPQMAADLFIESDAELLFKALSHIVSNAVKFTNKGEIELGFEPAIGNVSFWVKDTGIGIASNKINKVFEFFTQEDDSSSRRFEGSGLGLAIAKGIAQLLNGTIHVESVKGHGTTFSLLLPMDGSLKKTSERNWQLTQKEPLILLAEDDEANFTVIEMLLRKSFNAKVVRAVNGLDAVQQFKDNDLFDLVLMDIKMPVMDGLEATRILRNDLKTKKPIVAITAYAMSGDEQKAIESGCDSYLAKPVTRRELVANLKQLGFQQV